MAENEKVIQEIQDQQDEQPWEGGALNALHDSKIDQGPLYPFLFRSVYNPFKRFVRLILSSVFTDFANVKARKSGCKKHKVRYMKRPMAIPSVIIALQDEHCRESALRCLSTYLLEKREEDPDNYYRAGYYLYNSCCTMVILLQEVVEFFTMMMDQSLTVRACKRLANVLTLLQCIAANKEARQKFLKSLVPNFMVPLVLFKTPLEAYENVRAVSLSVIAILCQAREPKVIRWAVESNIVEVCRISIEIGNELSKVIAMHILEAILQDDLGISYICNSMHGHQIEKLMKTWEHLVAILAVDQDFSPRLLFHIIRCYVLLCNHVRGINYVMDGLPDPISNGSFNAIAEEFPVIGSLFQQLLVTVGKVDDCVVVALPYDLLLY